MKTVFEHIEYVRGKPHHVRRRFALGAATFGSALVALVWLAGSFMTGAFAIQGSSFAMTGQGGSIATTSASEESGLAGAAAALPTSSASAPAHIEIVDTTPIAQTKKPEPTILPF